MATAKSRSIYERADADRAIQADLLGVHVVPLAPATFRVYRRPSGSHLTPGRAILRYNFGTFEEREFR